MIFSNSLRRFCDLNLCVVFVAIVGVFLSVVARGVENAEPLTLAISQFEQQIQVSYTATEGLPSSDVLQIARDDQGLLIAKTKAGYARFEDPRWVLLSEHEAAEHFFEEPAWYDSLAQHVSRREMVRAVAERDGEVSVAAENGLYIGDGEQWSLALVGDARKRWAPIDVRAVVYDLDGRLWFASPQGVGRRNPDGSWSLF
ncbi:MAG: hypothetical protein KDA72_21130, partial [Planctomycetales bacterium]|nr:hypothetical protein [Planctomycetales bacterium]